MYIPSVSCNKTDGDKYAFMKRPVNSSPSLERKGEIREYRERHCYGCGRTDHFIKSCPAKAARNNVSTRTALLKVQEEVEEAELEVSRSDEPTDMNNTVATCKVTSVIDSSWLPSHKIKGLSTKINDTNCIPVESTLEQIGCSLKTMQPDKMPIKKGFIGKVEISVLRDSGCNFFIVKKNLVEEEQLTGKVAFCTLADGTKRKFPVGNLNVDTPYYTGKIEALCMPEPVCDLVLGNMNGVRPPENPDVNWFHEKEGNNSSMVGNNVAEARKQNKVKDKKNTLVVPSSINQIPDNDLIRLHAEDISPP